MLEKLKQAKEVFNTTVAKYKEWHKENTLLRVPDYSELAKKEVWGKSYQRDLNYFRDVSEMKSTMVGFKGYVSSLKTNLSATYYKMADNLLDAIAEQVRFLDNKIFTAKEQLEFYKTIMYVIANFSYGDYA